MSTSFCAETKNDLCGLYLKRPCCRRAFLYGAFLGGGGLSAERAELTTEHESFARITCKLLRGVFHIQLEPKIAEPMIVAGERVREMLAEFGYETGENPNSRICTERFSCEYDAGAFLRGVFLSIGTVTMPDASYHLELLPPNAELLDALRVFLTENSLEPKVLHRSARREASLYYKDSSAMEDFLNFIGAQKSAFRLMNVKIMRDIRNNANRLANCDMANIDKTIAAATKQMEAIWRIADEGRADLLPVQLRQTFDLRAAHPDVNLSELAAMHEPPISKSGVSHRLSKLIAFAEQGTEQAEKEET